MSRTYPEHPVRDYIAKMFAPEDALLQRIHAKGEEMRAGMQISPYEGKLLYMLLKMNRVKRVLEIGSFVGYSTTWMRRALPADGAITTLEFDSAHAAMTREHLAADDASASYELREGKALESLATLREEGAKFDAVFIDAMKREYMEYLDEALPMLPSGGLIMADNSLLFGHVVGQGSQKISESAVEVMQSLNARLANPEEFDGLMLNTDEGLTVAIKK